MRSEPKPALRDLEVDERLVRLLVDLEVLDRARAHARDLQVGALDEAERVVEHDRVAAACSGPLPPAPASSVGGAGGDGQHEECREDRAHLLAREHLAGIAVDLGRLPRVGAVLVLVLGGARAAVALVERRARLEGRAAQLGRHGRELAVGER